MSKPLTIEELKDIQVGDWVWISRLNNNKASGYVTDINFTAKMFTCKSVNRVATTARIADYGKTWLAYKNKEMAETNGEILELPCIRPIKNKIGELFEVVFIQCSGTVSSETYPEKEQAEARLAELKKD